MNSVLQEIILVFKKEITIAMRFKGTWLTMLMFSATAISLISLTLKGTIEGSGQISAIFWTVIFFSAATGVDRLFMEEEFSGAIKLLKIYGASQAIIFGKMLYGFLLLLILSVFTSTLFFALLNVSLAPSATIAFVLTLFLGVLGLSISGTFLAAISAASKVKSGLFTILMLPVTLPIILLGADVTSMAFEGKSAEFSGFIPMILYDLILTTSASILFDYIWYEDL